MTRQIARQFRQSHPRNTVSARSHRIRSVGIDLPSGERPVKKEKPPKETRMNSTLPTSDDIRSLPATLAGVYYLDDREARTARSRAYAINKDNAAGIRFLTRRSGRALLIWKTFTDE